MTTQDFNHGDLVIIEFIDYIKNGDMKPIKDIKILEYTIIVGNRNRRYIKDDKHGKSLLKNFKKDSSVKGSFGMIMWKNSWLNYGYKVLGGIDYKRNKQLELILS
jgi:hypothetical protein